MTSDTHLPLAPRDLLILSVLAEGPLHGYGIIKAVEARSESGVLLDPAHLYRVLRRMRRLEWIREAGGQEVPSEGDGNDSPHTARRRTYQVTPQGRALLAAELARLERLLRQAQPAVEKGA